MFNKNKIKLSNLCTSLSKACNNCVPRIRLQSSILRIRAGVRIKIKLSPSKFLENYNVRKKANFPFIFNIIFEDLRLYHSVFYSCLLLVYGMCCNYKTSQFRNAGKHVHTSRDTTMSIHTYRHRDVYILFYRCKDEPSHLSFTGNFTGSSHAVFSSHTTHKTVFSLNFSSPTYILMYSFSA